MTTPNEGVNDGVEFDAPNAFLARWEDADDKLSNTDEGKNDQEATNGSNEDDATDLDLLNEIEREDATDEDADGTDQNEADQDEDADNASLEASDAHVVKFTVDGEEQTVSVKDLKRLYGQEASLTRKSQEVAAARKAADAEGERYMVSAQKLLTKAEDRFKPFERIDWMVAQQKLKPDEFQALREEARAAHTDLEFLKAETDDVLGSMQADRAAQAAVTAKETITVLERDIPGWNREVYDKVRTFAVDTGMPAEMVNTIVDPAPLKIIHMAMRYAELKAKASQKKTAPKAAPKRVVPPSSSNAAKKIGLPAGGRAEGLNALKKSGRTEDAVSAFLGGWAAQSSDD